jgi:hypothetical protein
VGKATWWYVWTVVAATAYLYANLFLSVRTPFLLGGDQVYFWFGAQRILDGQSVYLDFFQFTPPGTDLVYAAFFKVFGAEIWVSNSVVIVLGVFMGCVCFSVSRQFMNGPQAALGTGLFLVSIYGKALNATHHWFAVLFVLVAVRILMRRITGTRVASSGALLGVASCFNHVHGGAALLGFAVFLVWNSKRNSLAPGKAVRDVAVLIFAFAFVLLCLSAYYLETVGPARLWYCLVVSASRYAGHASHRTLGLPPIHDGVLRLLPYLPVYGVLPVVYSTSLWRCWRSRNHADFPWNQVALVSLVGVFLFLDVAISINWLRLFAVSLPGIVLAVWELGKVQIQRRTALVTASIALACVAVHQIEVKRALSCARGELPAGRFATTPKAYEKLRWLAAHTETGEFFLQAGWPGLYLPLQVRSPLYVPTLSRWDGVLDEDILQAVEQMKARRVRYVLWTGSLDADSTDQLSVFGTYLRSSYRRVHRFDDGDVVWEKMEGRSEPGQ